MGRSRDHLRGCKHDEAGVSGEGRAAQARRSGCVPGHPNGCHQKPRLFPADSRGGRRHLRQRHSAGSARPSTARAQSRVRTPGPSRGAAVGGVRGEASALGPPRRGHGLNPGTEPSDWRAAAGTGRAGREAGPAPGRLPLRGGAPHSPACASASFLPTPGTQTSTLGRRRGGPGAGREPAVAERGHSPGASLRGAPRTLASAAP